MGIILKLLRMIFWESNFTYCMKRIEAIMKYVEDKELYPDLRIIEGAAEPEVVIDGKKVLMFSSNN